MQEKVRNRLSSRTKIPDEVIIQRIINRATCSNKECGAIYNLKYKPSKVEGICDYCGSKLSTRADDNEETVKQRLEVYYNNSKDLINYYKEEKHYIQFVRQTQQQIMPQK